jgi:hypothetical protein
MVSKFISPTKAASVELPRNALYIGKVTQVEGKNVFVEVPQLSPGFSYGPCQVVANNLRVEISKDDALVDVSTTSSSAVVSVSGGNGSPVVTSSGQFVVSVQESSDQFVTNVTVSLVPPPVGSFVICGFLNNSLDEMIVLGSILS